jgi:phosphoglycolate phosphatase-like HAD superfamily hydrolase
MAKKNEETVTSRKEETSRSTRTGSTEERKDAFRMWTESYSAMSKVWQESYANLYNPWIESTGKLFDKASELSKQTSPEKYKEFYEELVKTQQNTLGKLYPMPKAMTDRKTLEKLVTGAQESTNLMKSWSAELEENSKKTQKMLLGSAGPEDYKSSYEMWIKSYEKMFDEFLEMMTSKNTKDVFESYMGMPNIYLTNLAEAARMWRASYRDLYTPWAESTFELSEKFSELSKGNVSPEKYKEFYDHWMNTYKETFAKMFTADMTKPSKEMVENMLRGMNNSTEMYNSWLMVLEKMTEKMRALLTNATEPESYREFYGLWFDTYEKAFKDFFELMPVVEPMKVLLDPLKKAARVQADTYANATKMWMDATFGQKRAT